MRNILLYSLSITLLAPFISKVGAASGGSKKTTNYTQNNFLGQGQIESSIDKERETIRREMEEAFMDLCALPEDEIEEDDPIYQDFISKVDKFSIEKHGVNGFDICVKIKDYSSRMEKMKLKLDNFVSSSFNNPRDMVKEDAEKEIWQQQQKELLVNLEQDSFQNQNVIPLLWNKLKYGWKKTILWIYFTNTDMELNEFCTKWWKVKGNKTDFSKLTQDNPSLFEWTEFCLLCYKTQEIKHSFHPLND